MRIATAFGIVRFTHEAIQSLEKAGYRDRCTILKTFERDVWLINCGGSFDFLRTLYRLGCDGDEYARTGWGDYVAAVERAVNESRL